MHIWHLPSVVIRYAADDDVQWNIPAEVDEHFIKILVVESSAADNLYNTFLHKLEILGFDVGKIDGRQWFQYEETLEFKCFLFAMCM